MTDVLMTTYKPLPVAFTRGEGVWLEDASGKRYLDVLSGVAVCSLGHAHPAISEAICAQAQQLLHTSNWYQIPRQQELGERLVALAGMDRVFFANSGAEANEAAIKLTRLFAHRKSIENPVIVVMDNSFHGRTMATLSATGSRKVQAGFEPLVPGFVRVPFGDIDAIRNLAAKQKNIVAVLVEPIQGEGGVNLPPPGYLAALRDKCDKHDWLLIFDEIQTGMGRTGEWFGFQHEGVRPDIMTLAKALGNGMPIGACLASGAAAELFAPGNHGSTFGGNPLACATAMAVIDTLEKEQVLANTRARSEQLLTGLGEALEGQDGVVEIRGQGLIIGIELAEPCAELMTIALDNGLLINVTADRVVRLLPPLIINEEQTRKLIEQLVPMIKTFLQQHGYGS